MSKTEAVVQALAEALEVDVSEIDQASELRAFATFDSIGILTLIGLLDDRLGFILDPDRIPALVTVEDLCIYVNESS
jgi:acyl carrier protein